MAVFEMIANSARRGKHGGIQVLLGIGQGDPFPRKLVDVKNPADLETAFAAYKAEAAASGQSLQLVAWIKNGERSPRGMKNFRLKTEVNLVTEA